MADARVQWGVMRRLKTTWESTPVLLFEPRAVTTRHPMHCIPWLKWVSGEFRERIQDFYICAGVSPSGHFPKYHELGILLANPPPPTPEIRSQTRGSNRSYCTYDVNSVHDPIRPAVCWSPGFCNQFVAKGLHTHFALKERKSQNAILTRLVLNDDWVKFVAQAHSECVHRFRISLSFYQIWWR